MSRLQAALKECMTDDGAAAYQSFEYAVRRIKAINAIAEAAIKKHERTWTVDIGRFESNPYGTSVSAGSAEEACKMVAMEAIIADGYEDDIAEWEWSLDDLDYNHGDNCRDPYWINSCIQGEVEL